MAALLFSLWTRQTHELVCVFSTGLCRGRYKTRNGTEPEVFVVQCGHGCWTHGQNIALIRTVRFCVQTLISRLCNSYKDGTSTNREPRQAYKTAEVGYSQLWAQSWVMLAYVLLDRTGNGFHIKISVMLNQSKPALAQTKVSK